MFNLVNGLTGLLGPAHQVNPNQKGTTDVVADNTRQTTLAFSQTRQLFGFTVKLFNLPATARHLLCRRDIRLTQVIRNDIIRAPSRRYPEKLSLCDLWETCEVSRLCPSSAHSQTTVKNLYVDTVFLPAEASTNRFDFIGQ